MSNLPVIDDIYIRHVFDALGNMQVELDGDPLVFGPKRLNAKVALCREHLSKCQQIYLQLADHLHQLSRASRQAKLDFDIKAQDLLANDPEVKSQRAIRDREAVVSSKLRVERETNHIIETAITDLESVIMVVKAKREDLKDIQGRIRDQVKLCQEEIGLGSKWGSAPPPGVRIDLDARPRVDTRALEQLNEVLEGLDGESSVTDLANFVRDEMVSRGEPVPQELVKPVPEEDEINLDDVLESPVVQKAEPVAPIEKVVEPSIEKVVEPPIEEEAVEEEAVEEPFALPEVAPVEEAAPVQVSSASVAEVEDFFNALDAGAPTVKSSAPPAAPPSVDDLDIDDLIGELGS